MLLQMHEIKLFSYGVLALQSGPWWFARYLGFGMRRLREKIDKLFDRENKESDYLGLGF